MAAVGVMVVSMRVLSRRRHFSRYVCSCVGRGWTNVWTAEGEGSKVVGGGRVDEAGALRLTVTGGDGDGELVCRRFSKVGWMTVYRLWWWWWWWWWEGMLVVR